jgi:hypothetical protein
MHEYKEPKEGYIFRNKANPDDFSSALYIGEGRSADEWEEVPIAEYEERQVEQERKMREEMGMMIDG